VTFAEYNWCFCAQFSFDLVTLTFDLLNLLVTNEISFMRPTHIPIFSIIRLSVPELWVTEYDHVTITWNGHCACAVSRDLSPGGGQKWFTFLKSLTPNSVFPLWRLQSLLRMRSIMWPVHRGSPKTTRDNFWPQIIYSLYNLYGASTTIKSCFTLENPHVKSVFGHKKTKSSQNRSPKRRFFGNSSV